MYKAYCMHIQYIFIQEYYNISDMNEEINQAFKDLGVLLMLDAPKQLCFGIDNIQWEIGNMFKGVKLIPLGIHIITYSLKDQNHMFRISRFINFTLDHKIHVFRWSFEASLFLQLKGEEADGYRQGVKQYYFDSYLGPYPSENLNFWKQNTRFITKKVLDKLDPIDHMQCFSQEYGKSAQTHPKEDKLVIDQEGQEEGIKNQENQQQQEENDGKMKNQVGKFSDLSDTIYYSEIPRKLKVQTEHTSKINMDKTEILEYVLMENWIGHPEDILGEVQYSFISFLIGQNEESYRQWKKLVGLFCDSQKAFTKKSQLMGQFLLLLAVELSQFPVDFFVNELSKENFLSQCLRKLKIYKDEETVPQKIGKKITKLLQMVVEKFNYVIQSENEEQCPVIVQMDSTYF